jgi:hypothetical protein
MIYESVHRVELNIEGGWMRGWAYPRSGPRCCALGLYNEGSLVFALRCDRFNKEAANRGLRDGWCGFELCLDPEFFIESDRVVIRCLRSGVELAKIEFGQVGATRRATTPQRSTVELLITEAESGLFEIEPYLPMIERLAARMSDEKFVIFLFRFLLRHVPKDEKLAAYVRKLRSAQSYKDIIDEIRGSADFRRYRNSALPNVFSEAFPALAVFVEL